ncbi:phosphoserine aminotransferase apoenzyme [Andreprevotia lacus DSM 23236]|jgi:phosphoserine aminotransferase|uniref:Phosphoserine aminotransferase n=1 Tax=Andreprevotia lacus DSM 23236 TaxID=1121001 RepID=A0A1W1XZE9_9NEIS|nr:3-phosphoserine/phosphohydroxythreonine transaminase [Andreprevotia lacus]SMC28878.1 phosphoserine aminotransferase apoenzyme [Andreprevotia lacus DSM 23236]
MTQVFNFSAGPAVLPREVLLQVQQELTDWHGTGMCVMEMSHRGKEFTQIIHEAEADLRQLMGIPSNYKVLFLQGGAHFQFSMLPLNLARQDDTVDYVNTGHWSKIAIKEARRYANVNIAASSEDRNFSYVPDEAGWKKTANAAYLHYCSNETIGGVEFPFIPDAGNVPLICDMSSNILSKPVDVSKFGLIYAGAQKNIGPSGLTLAIVREDLLGRARPETPTMLDYKVQADGESLYNTPPTFAIYVAGLVFKWLLAQGGVRAIEQRNIEKAALLYETIDASGGFYHCPVDRANRSRMNVAFTLGDESLDDAFLEGAKARELLQLKGHRSVGGMRASIYNAMTVEGVRALTDYMREFASSKG